MSVHYSLPLTLCTMFQSEYRKRGFQEVVSPNIYNSKLWITSGHWQHYSVSGWNVIGFVIEYCFRITCFSLR